MMTCAPPTDRRTGTAAAAVAVLAASNVVANRRLGPAGYVPWNLAMATGLTRLARWAGCSPNELGMDRRRRRRGLAAGAAGAGMVAGGYGIVLASPRGAALLSDRRVTSLSPAAARWHVLVRIPLGTVALEEVAFRGVLPALLAPPGRPGRLAGTASSVLFGLWHVLPSRDLARANAGLEPATGGRGPRATTALAIVATTIAGGGLHRLRQLTGHLAAPAMVHLAANMFGFVAARHVKSGY